MQQIVCSILINKSNISRERNLGITGYYNSTTIRNWTPQTTIVAKLRKGHNQCQRCPRSCYVMHQIKDAIASVTPSMLDRVCSNIGTLSTTLQMRCAQKSIDPRQETISIISGHGSVSITSSKIIRISDNIFIIEVIN